MRSLLFSIQIVLCLLLLENLMIYTSNGVYAEQEVPPHAKWGQIAMQKTKEKYPQVNIVDYLHIGREKGEDTSVEKFKLWLKENNKEFGVFVDITFDNKTEQIIDIKFTETTRQKTKTNFLPECMYSLKSLFLFIRIEMDHS